MYPILTYGSEEQKQHWLPRLQSGEAIGCFGLTEPDFGSNPVGMLTCARQEGEGWVLDGEKTWITNSSVADIALVWARTNDGIRGFLVERGTPGFTAPEIHGQAEDQAALVALSQRLARENERVIANGFRAFGNSGKGLGAVGGVRTDSLGDSQKGLR